MGSHVCEKLANRGWDITVTTRRPRESGSPLISLLSAMRMIRYFWTAYLILNGMPLLISWFGRLLNSARDIKASFGG